MTTPDTLTELKAAVEGMRKPIPKPVITAFEQRNLWDEGHNAACDQFQHLIDEMIRRG